MKTIIALALMVPAFAGAEFLSGNSLLQRLQSTDTVSQMVGLGYVMGVFDATQGSMHCAPNDSTITAKQVRDIAEVWLVQNPEHRNLQADVLVTVSLARVWPCPQKKGKGV